MTLIKPIPIKKSTLSENGLPTIIASENLRSKSNRGSITGNPKIAINPVLFPALETIAEIIVKAAAKLTDPADTATLYCQK